MLLTKTTKQCLDKEKKFIPQNKSRIQDEFERADVEWKSNKTKDNRNNISLPNWEWKNLLVHSLSIYEVECMKLMM